MNKSYTKLVAGLLLAGASSLASAQGYDDCSSPLSLYEYYAGQGDTYWMEYIRANHPACFGGGAAGASQGINTTSFIQATAISASIANRLSARQGGAPIASNTYNLQGMAAGGTQQPWNVWASYDNNDTDVDYVAKLSGAKITGNTKIDNAILGIDYVLSPTMVAGVSVAFDDGKSWSANNGASAGRSDTDGYTIAPYFAFQLTKDIAVDVSAGYGQGKYKTLSTKADIDRWFAAANVSYDKWIDNVQLSGKLSYLHGNEKIKDRWDNTTSTTLVGTGTQAAIDQLRLRMQAGYWTNGMMPFAAISYSSNVGRSKAAKTDQIGRDAFIGSVGLNFFSLASKISGGIQYEQEFSRKNSDNKMLTLNINFRF